MSLRETLDKPWKPSEPQFPHRGNGDFPKGLGLSGRRLPHCWAHGKDSGSSRHLGSLALPTQLCGAPADRTCQRVDEAAGQQGQHGDQSPVGEALVAQAAVDGHCGFVTLEGRGGAQGDGLAGGGATRLPGSKVEGNQQRFTCGMSRSTEKDAHNRSLHTGQPHSCGTAQDEKACSHGCELPVTS